MQINHEKYPVELPCKSKEIVLRKPKASQIQLCCQTPVVDVATGIVSKIIFLGIRKHGELIMSSKRPSGDIT